MFDFSKYYDEDGWMRGFRVWRWRIGARRLNIQIQLWKEEE